MRSTSTIGQTFSTASIGQGPGWCPTRSRAESRRSRATVKRAVEEIGARVATRAVEGAEVPNDWTFLTQPRAFLVVGHRGQLLGKGGGPHPERTRSFELTPKPVA